MGIKLCDYIKDASNVFSEEEVLTILKSAGYVESKYLCLYCNCLFREWKTVEFNNAKVCPLCGISSNCGMYEVVE